MLFTEEKFERFAMQAEAVSQGEVDQSDPAKWWVDVDVVGAALGLTPHESRFLASHLKNAGWADLQYPEQVGSPKLKLTLQGFREIARLRWPWWRRWLNKNGTTFIAWTSFVMGVVLFALRLLGK